MSSGGYLISTIPKVTIKHGRTSIMRVVNQEMGHIQTYKAWAVSKSTGAKATG
jgi:hypothetical protein